MITQAPAPKVVAIAVAFALSCVGLVLFVWSTLGGTTPLKPRGYEVQLTFNDASQLNPNADVRIAGVNVGKVERVRQVGLHSNATISLDSEYAPLRSDARAILRQKTLLGETFVELAPGSRSSTAIPDGGSLSPSRVVPRQSLDRLLGTLDAQTRRHLQRLLSGGGAAVAGRGTDLNDSLGNLDPVTESLQTLATTLDHQHGSVRELVRDSGTVLGTVADRRSAVDDLIRQGDAVFAATAARNRSVTQTVARLPGLLAQLKATMARLDTTAAIATPTLHAMRPVAASALPALRGLDAAAPQAIALFRGLDRLIPTARRALPATATLVRGLTPFTDALYPAAANIVPVIDLMSAYKRELVASAANVAAASQATAPVADGRNLNYLRFVLPLTDESLVGQDQRQPGNRHNAYPAPGAWNAIGREGLAASDCRNLSNPQTAPPAGTGAPPCRVQGAWEFSGAKRYYPHVGAKR
ncbi:MAG: phospholipid/cholesterol/gamma-HCH transport system substrate-binding protein [Thermoleophilaceae bacterium]|nr:phospholipid/cholesterol/gamma-HCH transport system substrate-binding protein [Thermoleophilaceae bacterium]